MVLITATLALSLTGCGTPGGTFLGSVDKSKPREHPEMWRQVKADPPTYVPAAWPAGKSTGLEHGEWLIDPQDGTSHFIPNEELAGIQPGVWKGEAYKITNRYSKQEIRRQNWLTVRESLLKLPVVAPVELVCGLAGAGAEGVGPGTYTDKKEGKRKR